MGPGKRGQTMSYERVKNFLADNMPEKEIIQFGQSTATVELAAEALGVDHGRIAKTIAIKRKTENILLVAKGDVRVDNKKFKSHFGEKVKFVSLNEVREVTGFPVGGVCPFDAGDMRIFLDESLKKYDYVYPAAGEVNTAVKMTISELEEITKGKWVDVCE